MRTLQSFRTWLLTARRRFLRAAATREDARAPGDFGWSIGSASAFDAVLVSHGRDPEIWRRACAHLRAPADIRPRFAVAVDHLPAEVVAVAVRGASPTLSDLVILDRVRTSDAAIDRAVLALALDPVPFDGDGAARSFLVAPDGAIARIDASEPPPAEWVALSMPRTLQWGPLPTPGGGKSDRRRVNRIVRRASAVPPTAVMQWVVRIAP